MCDTNTIPPSLRIPFYGYIRLLFLLYLVLPQTQGARVIYTKYLHPWLEDNEAQIEDFIATTHDKMKTAGIAYIKRAIEAVRVNVLGLPPNPNANAAAEHNVPTAQRPQSYTQTLLARFTLPQARWSGGGAGSTGQEFYNLLAGAVSAATATVSNAAGGGASSSSGAAGGESAANMSASGTLIPPNIRGASEKMSFIAAQRERLNIVLSALDREAQQLETNTGPNDPEAERQRASIARDLNLEQGQGPSKLDPGSEHANADEEEQPTQRPASGLSKSRSEADFEKIDAESGAEDEGRTPAVSGGGAGGGSWLPWGWGSGGGVSDASSRTAADDLKKSQ